MQGPEEPVLLDHCKPAKEDVGSGIIDSCRGPAVDVTIDLISTSYDI